MGRRAEAGQARLRVDRIAHVLQATTPRPGRRASRLRHCRDPRVRTATPPGRPAPHCRPQPGDLPGSRGEVGRAVERGEEHAAETRARLQRRQSSLSKLQKIVKEKEMEAPASSPRGSCAKVPGADWRTTSPTSPTTWRPAGVIPITFIRKAGRQPTTASPAVRDPRQAKPDAPGIDRPGDPPTAGRRRSLPHRLSRRIADRPAPRGTSATRLERRPPRRAHPFPHRPRLHRQEPQGSAAAATPGTGCGAARPSASRRKPGGSRLSEDAEYGQVQSGSEGRRHPVLRRRGPPSRTSTHCATSSGRG